MEYINILIGKKYVCRGFFFKYFIKEWGKNIFCVGFLEVFIILI